MSQQDISTATAGYVIDRVKIIGPTKIASAQVNRGEKQAHAKVADHLSQGVGDLPGR